MTDSQILKSGDKEHPPARNLTGKTQLIKMDIKVTENLERPISAKEINSTVKLQV